jgi:hypothetical protein
MTHDVDNARDASLPRPDKRSVRLMLLLKLVTTCNTQSYANRFHFTAPSHHTNIIICGGQFLTAKEHSSSVVEGGVYVTDMLLVSPDASHEYGGGAVDTAR